MSLIQEHHRLPRVELPDFGVGGSVGPVDGTVKKNSALLLRRAAL